MQKRLLAVIAALVLFLPIAGAIPPTSAIVYGSSQGIYRSTTLPGENVHIEAQQEATIASKEQLDALNTALGKVQQQVNDLRVSAENQRVDIVAQLGNINRELGAIKTSADNMQALQRQVSEIRPTLEQPREIIPPMSLVALSVANMLLLIIVIVMMLWLRGQMTATQKESHVEEHSLIHLTDFIREAMHKGASLAEIRRRLLERGWNEARVDDAIQEVRAMHAA
jgi:hypothetical protein